LLWLRTKRTRDMDSLDDGRFGARVHLGSWCVASACKDWREQGYPDILTLLEANLPSRHHDAKATLDEVRAMQSDQLEALKMAVSILTAVQALCRAMKPGETREEMAAKCQKLRTKHSLPLTPKLSLMLSQLARGAAAKATGPSSAPTVA